VLAAESSKLKVRLTLLLAGFLVAYAAYSAGTFLASPARGEVVGNQTGLSKGRGFDRCQFPSRSQMDDWWFNSPYTYYGTYLGGPNSACNVPGREWYSDVHTPHAPKGLSWDFLPLWVGKQPPCSSLPYRMSGDATNSYQAARNEAANEVDTAVGVANSRGFTSPGTILYYDLEAYETENSNCNAATRAYINVWSKRLQETYGAKSGLYGSACGSLVNQFWTVSYPPNDAWFADWNGTGSVYAVACTNKERWEQRRFHQYRGEAWVKYGETLLQIDVDCAYGIVAGWGQGDETVCYS
jgi:hypothetical protein